MKKPRRLILVICIFSVFLTGSMVARTYELFGYSDFIFMYGKQEGEIQSTFLQNRTNLILSSELYKRWLFFFNTEFNGELDIRSYNDYSSDSTEVKTKGNLHLEEAWTSYTLSDAFCIKAGIFLAPFGRFNVIQNMSPTYVTVRPPIIYDDDFRNRSPVQINPGRSNLEISGIFRSKKAIFEYHVYAGNGEGTKATSMDANVSKAIGARLVFTYDTDLMIGASGYYDKAEFSFSPQNPAYSVDTGNSFMQKRYLLSIDFNYTFSIFNINGEYVFNHNKSLIDDNPDDAKVFYYSITDKTYNRKFYYFNLNAEVIDKLRGYFETDYYQDFGRKPSMSKTMSQGVYKNIIGINFKPNWRTALKGEIQLYSFKSGYRSSFSVFMTSLSVVF